jgi:hypothetical protein
MSELPFIDAHTVAVEAPPERVWDAVSDAAVGAFGSPVAALFARVIGCTDTAVVPGADGGPPSAVVGFRLAEARRPSLLILRGEHRFSSYELKFVVTPGTLRAETRAVFPGPAGRVYRAAVIGTGAHVVVTRRLLRAIKRRAERSAPAH